jgi:hypothetical protein
LFYLLICANLQRIIPVKLRKVAWKRASSLSHSGNRNCEICAETLKQKTILFKLN